MPRCFVECLITIFLAAVTVSANAADRSINPFKEKLPPDRAKGAWLSLSGLRDGVANKNLGMFQQAIDGLLQQDPASAHMVFIEFRSEQPPKEYLEKMDMAENRLPPLTEKCEKATAAIKDRAELIKKPLEIAKVKNLARGTFLKDGKFVAIFTESGNSQDDNSRLVVLDPTSDKAIVDIDLRIEAGTNLKRYLDIATYFLPSCGLVLAIDEAIQKYSIDFSKLAAFSRFPIKLTDNLSFEVQVKDNQVWLKRGDGKSKLLGSYSENGKGHPAGYFFDGAQNRIVVVINVVFDRGYSEGGPDGNGNYVHFFGGFLDKGKWK